MRAPTAVQVREDVRRVPYSIVKEKQGITVRSISDAARPSGAGGQAHHFSVLLHELRKVVRCVERVHVNR